MSVEIVTFGCRLNAFESEMIVREAERAGLSDTIVVNSCAVTNEAVAQHRTSYAGSDCRRNARRGAGADDHRKRRRAFEGVRYRAAPSSAVVARLDRAIQYSLAL
jgi:Uncharacterized protein family UPF0004